ncbi:MAG: helix-hairpin-helix domain-containing protein [Anaerolineae bacterium]|nr:helix-hairpin-helix domain-containing protein [Anaerolineae bacterium]
MTRLTKILLPPAALIVLALTAACSAAAPAPSSAPQPTTAIAQPTAAPEQPVAAGIVTATPANQSAEPSGVTAAVFTKLNLNTATPQEILTVPNTGNRMVREFQEYRPYTSIQQFRREIGKYVDAATIAEYEKYVYVPVDVNQADAETLQQIPGVTADIAGQLIAGRPYGTNQNFLAKLVSLVSAEQAAAAQNYLSQ